MVTNIHIFASSFHNESRILKETHSLASAGIADRVYIVALWESGDVVVERLDNKRTVLRLKLKTKIWPKSIFFQFFKLLEFILRAILLSHRLRVDIVNVHYVDLLPLGWLVKTIFRARLVYDTHELETETYGLKGMRKVASKFVERLFIRSCSFVIVVGDLINDWYRNTYNIANVITVMNCPYYHAPPTGQGVLREELGISDGKRILIYQGGIAKGRGVEQLLEVFAAQDDGEHVLVCMGYGPLCDLVKKYADKYENIFFREAVAPDVIMRYTGSADYGVAYIDNDSLNDRYCLPNKFFEYIMARKPVLVNDSEEMKKLVRQYKIGTFIRALDRDALSRFFKIFDNTDIESLQANLEDAAQKFCWEAQHEVMIQGYRKYILEDRL